MRTTRVAWGLTGLAALCSLATSVLYLTTGLNPFTHETEIDGFPVTTLGALLATVLGALVLSRHPRHPVGWLLCAGQAGTAAGLAADAYVFRTGSPAAVVAGSLLGGAYAVAVTCAVVLLVPDGRLLSRRWLPVLALLGLAYLSSLVPLDGIREAGVVTMAIAAAAAAVALVLRLRRSRGVRRQQLRWVVTGALLLAVGLAMFAAGLTPWGLYLGFAAVPICAGIAILRYRLYDIDVIINRAIVLAVLAAFVTAGYISLVVIAGAGLRTRLPSGFWPSLGVLVVVALAFQPLRQRVLRLADRLVYGRRAVPYEALSDFTRLLSRSRAADDLLPVMAETLARRIGAASAGVSAQLPALSASWPEPTERAPDVDLEVRDGAGVLGRIALVLPPGRALLPAERRLLDDFAAQAALALRNLRLDAELRDQAEQMERQAAALESSRRRLLAAQDDERRRTAGIIEREVVRHLRPIPDAVAGLDLSDPGAVRSTLGHLEEATEAALDALREVTHGVYPALLSHHGLVAALSGHATRTGRSGALTIDTGLADLRLSEQLESAAYFCAAALLTQAQALTVAAENGMLVLQATGEPDADDGVADRVEAAGGRMTRRPNQDGRSTVRVEIPVQPSPPASTQAASSRSMPSEDLTT